MLLYIKNSLTCYINVISYEHIETPQNNNIFHQLAILAPYGEQTYTRFIVDLIDTYADADMLKHVNSKGLSPAARCLTHVKVDALSIIKAMLDKNGPITFKTNKLEKHHLDTLIDNLLTLKENTPKNTS